jgi:glycosyltransferase involved in cell wall biosynthesis
MFDMGSLASRKNPEAAIEAFRMAFGDRQDVQFTLKVTKPVEDRRSWDRLCLHVKPLSNVSVLGDTLSRSEMSRLYDTHDIYLSLHRAEGYGLTIREAMQHGMHVVATGWSGNMDFMHGDKAWPVGYELVPVQADGDFRGMGTCRWAEPSVEDAARILTEIDRTERSKSCA